MRSQAFILKLIYFTLAVSIRALQNAGLPHAIL